MIELETLLKPIAKKEPTGKDLREDVSVTSLYYQAKDARNTARQIERKIQTGEHSKEDENPRWDTVLDICTDILANHSKDLEIAVWLLEALVREHGFAGLTQGFELLANLSDTYWDNIYPVPDEDGIQTRIMPLISLNGEDYDGILVQPINNIKITQGSSIEPLALWQYKQALANEKITDDKAKAKKAELGETVLEHVKKAVTESSQEFYNNLWEDIHQSLQSLKQLNSTLDTKCGKDAPSFARVAGLIESFADHINFILEDAPFNIQTSTKPIEESTTDKDPDTPIESVEMISSTPKITNSKIVPDESMNRKQAFQQLDQLITFFKTTEPFSPVAYILERAKTWGNIPFPELLKELVKDEVALEKAFELAGLQ